MGERDEIKDRLRGVNPTQFRRELGRGPVSVWDPVRNCWATIERDSTGLKIHPSPGETHRITFINAINNWFEGKFRKTEIPG